MLDSQYVPSSQKTNHFCQASINLRLVYFSCSKQIKCESTGNAEKY